MNRPQKLATFFVFTLIIAVAIAAWIVRQQKQSPFLLRCKERLEQENYVQSAQSNLCEALRARFFSGWDPIQEIQPSTVGAPPLPVDSQVRFIAFYDPDYLAGFAYCYFAFRGWFDPKKISPTQLALSASGFTILKDELEGYSAWLESDAGETCRIHLMDGVGQKPIDLAKEIGEKVAVIAVNPVGAIRSDGGMEPLLREMLLTMNHERIHAIQVSCPRVDEAAVKHWQSLDSRAREALKVGRLEYDWNNPKVAVREAFAYWLEENPLKILEYTESCYRSQE